MNKLLNKLLLVARNLKAAALKKPAMLDLKTLRRLAFEAEQAIYLDTKGFINGFSDDFDAETLLGMADALRRDNQPAMERRQAMLLLAGALYCAVGDILIGTNDDPDPDQDRND